MWLGLKRHNMSTFVWASDGQLLTSYTNWDRGEPNHVNNDEDCAEFTADIGAWNDVVCDKAMPFVFCERIIHSGGQNAVEKNIG